MYKNAAVISAEAGSNVHMYIPAPLRSKTQRLQTNVYVRQFRY
jgi:hypothetical protein